jgi:hypothetical protein
MDSWRKNSVSKLYYETILSYEVRIMALGSLERELLLIILYNLHLHSFAPSL